MGNTITVWIYNISADGRSELKRSEMEFSWFSRIMFLLSSKSFLVTIYNVYYTY